MLMKMLKTAILSVLLLSFLSVPVLAQSQTRIATVDMQKLFNDYWKKKTAQVALDNHKAELRKEITDLSDGLTKSQADYKTLVEAANDQTLSAAEREKNRAAAKAKDIGDSKDSLERIQRQAEAQLADQSQRMSANLLQDLQKAISDQAKAKGFNLVLNTRTETVAYAGTENDITADVLKQLNAGAPIDVTQPASIATGTAGTNAAPRAATTP